MLNGLDLKLPFYLNLAPNYDATLTPRWLSLLPLCAGGNSALGREIDGS